MSWVRIQSFAERRSGAPRRDRDRRKRNRRQTEWNTGLVRIFLRCEGGKPVKVNPPNRVVSRAACLNVFRYVRGGTRKSNVIA